MSKFYLGNPTNTLAVINRYEFAFQKKFGQNFLIDQGIVEKIVREAGVTKDDFVLEIGPGIGTMTQILCENAREVAAVEIDRKLIPILNDTLSEYDNVESHVPLDSITIMVQKEVADRMQTGPGSKDYGALSLAVQFYAKPEIVVNVPPECFMPRPNVGSAVIRLKRHETRPVDVKDEKLMFRIIRASFNQRRKTLANGLNNSPEIGYTKEQIAAAIEELGRGASIRGEALTLEEFARLSNIFSSMSK